LLNATISITPEANPIEKLTTLSVTFLSNRTTSPPIPVAEPAIRLRRNGSIIKLVPFPSCHSKDLCDSS
jgi:hypothetical protein